MRRPSFGIFSRLSLLICVATAAIWATGWRFPWPGIRPLVGRWGYIAVADQGHIFFEVFHGAATPVVGPPLGRRHTETPAIIAWRKQFGPEVHLDCLGAGLGRMLLTDRDGAGNETYNGITWWFTAPYWAIIVVSGAFPIFVWLIQRRRRRILWLRRGFCRTCGYDLRATPNRCPECGAVPVAVTH